MDRDDYLRILEEPCCYNIDNFILDKEWSGISGLSHIQVDGSEEDHFLYEYEDIWKDKKPNKKDKKVYKVLE